VKHTYVACLVVGCHFAIIVVVVVDLFFNAIVLYPCLLEMTASIVHVLFFVWNQRKVSVAVMLCVSASRSLMVCPTS